MTNRLGVNSTNLRNGLLSVIVIVSERVSPPGDEMRHGMKLFSWVACFTLWSSISASGLAADTWLSGKARVLSGDRLVIGEQIVKLSGIRVPGPKAPCFLSNGKPYDCAVIARTALQDLTAGARVRCRLAAKKNGSTVQSAICTVNGFDLSRNMVNTGWALPYPRKNSPLIDVETESKQARRGLWRGKFDLGWSIENGR